MVQVRIFPIGCCFFLLALLGCSQAEEDDYVEKTMEVTVTAYNAVPWQTTATDPDIAAWGDTLRPGMQCIAVSRDLIKLGLKHRAMVRIEGLEGEFMVLDKMNRRYRQRIDIFMGIDVPLAREWGRQKRTITWKVPRGSDYDKRYQYQPLPADTL